MGGITTKASKPFFSIIISYRYDHDGEEKLLRLLRTIKSQSCNDYEVILVHDGKDLVTTKKLDVTIEELRVTVIKTVRMEDWGHTQRQVGFRRAKGKYILFTNADNTYYDCLEELKERIVYSGYKEFYSMPVLMVGCLIKNNKMTRTYKEEDKALLNGRPLRYNIDVMCGVVSKKAWLSIGGWHDKSEESDWKLYEELNNKYGCYYCEGLIIGEHW